MTKSKLMALVLIMLAPASHELMYWSTRSAHSNNSTLPLPDYWQFTYYYLAHRREIFRFVEMAAALLGQGVWSFKLPDSAR